MWKKYDTQVVKHPSLHGWYFVPIWLPILIHPLPSCHRHYHHHLTNKNVVCFSCLSEWLGKMSHNTRKMFVRKARQMQMRTPEEWKLVKTFEPATTFFMIFFIFVFNMIWLKKFLEELSNFCCLSLSFLFFTFCLLFLLEDKCGWVEHILVVFSKWTKCFYC